MAEKRFSMLNILAVIVFVAAAIGLLAYLFMPSGWERVHKIDFTQTDVNPMSVPGDDRPVLRVAVAAMISPKNTKKYYNDLLRLIGKKMGMRTEFYQRKTYAEVNDLLERKEIDTAFVCAGPYVTGKDKFGMELVAVPVVHGQKIYHSYFLAHKDSPIKSFQDFRGKRFAFTDPHSNTGFMVPTFVLSRMGETAKSFFGETFLTHSHDNSIKAVAEGLAAGAAVDSLIWEFMNEVDPTYTGRTKIIEKSPAYGIPPVVVHPDIPAESKKRLREIFLSLHKDPEGAAILKQLQIERFEVGEDAMYDSVRDMERWLHKEEIKH